MKTGLKIWSINTQYYLPEAQKLYEKKVFDYIELYTVPDSLDTIDKWAELNIPFILHNPHFAQNFNLADKEKRNLNRNIYEQTLRFADKLNPKYIIFHGGMNGNKEEVTEQLAGFKEPRALLENKPFVVTSGKICRGAVIEEIKYILNEVKCGFCLDFGHAVCAANYQKINPYEYIKELNNLKPKMYHLSDVLNMNNIYDEHPHLGTGKLDIAKIKREILSENSIISVETEKDSKENLDDFARDIKYLKDI